MVINLQMVDWSEMSQTLRENIRQWVDYNSVVCLQIWSDR